MIVITIDQLIANIIEASLTLDEAEAAQGSELSGHAVADVFLSTLLQGPFIEVEPVDTPPLELEHHGDLGDLLRHFAPKEVD